MKSIDIVIVSYNSEKWINQCLESLKNVNYPLKNLYITFVDNSSTDDSKKIIESYPQKALFGGFNYHFSNENLGFGKANNFAVERTEQEFVFFLNVDTELDENCIQELMNSVEHSDEFTALWECRQFPYEHPKIYHPVTSEVSWASAAACLVRRDYFVQVGMFDENIFMYAEDVDLSWRFRAHGYKLRYAPKSIVHHYTYMSANEVKPNQFYNSTYNNLMLRYKFGSWKDIYAGYALFSALFFIKGPSQNHRKIITKNAFKSVVDGLKFRKWKRVNKQVEFSPDFKVWDYEIIRDGAFYINELPEERPLVSVLIRTCGRPSVLRETLESVRNQTYSNIQVVIVEDGPAISQAMIEAEFSDLNVKYHATVDNVGRCEVANIALDIADGEYCNFLDDDDVFFADHIEVLCTQLLKHPQKKAAYSLAFETPISVISKEPYVYKELFHNVNHRQPFNRLILLHHNYFPIQCVLFSRSLYTELGGMDKELEVLEDWDLWLKYALRYDFHYVEKVTSVYRVPSEVQQVHSRQQLFDKYLHKVREKHGKEQVQLSFQEIFVDAETIMNRPQTIIYHMKRMSLKAFLYKSKNKTYGFMRKLIKK
ncbi:glycosyltransferase family 2 protein [Paenibacillus sp. SC116]|uniref:glycosyltransferase family 2 protein n=1 Tax=Paenibacillus sp. SC116 TaxID=2968986 RepID=UPI00215A6A9F|nr:glycosyltransferase family 2 protein [Paenibacillus sp. SC116]MCR8844851.1 glycosyltransferase family 2 protein [Paenibacillus sp. SC116]